jgi:endonuclease YncB( thermonuclease family)
MIDKDFELQSDTVVIPQGIWYLNGQKSRGLESGSNSVYEYQGIVDRILDGDTVYMLFVFGGMDMTKGNGNEDECVQFRLWGINAPETHSKNLLEKEAGLLVKAYLEKILPPKGARVRFRSTAAKKDLKKEKFGRYLCDIYLTETETVSNHMIEKGYCKSYEGEKKPKWTKAELNAIIKKLK